MIGVLARHLPIAERHMAPLGRHTVPFELYDAPHTRRRHAGSTVVVLASGLLGDGTMGHLASEIAGLGYPVAIPLYDRKGIRALLHPDQARAERLYATALEASKLKARRSRTCITNPADVILVGHSNGGQDVTRVSTHNATRQAFRIAAVATNASVGMQDNAPFDHVQHAGVRFVDVPIAQGRTPWQGQVERRAARNIVGNPLLNLEEALSCISVRCRSTLLELARMGHIGVFDESYQVGDEIIHAPKGHGDYTLYPGGHMTPVYNLGIVRNILERLH